jgi:hypothetical protein
MRNISKFKIFFKSKKIVDSFPKRLKNFKRTKWKKFRSFNKFKIKIKSFLLNFNSNFKYKSIRQFQFKSKLIKRNKFKNLFFPQIKKGKNKTVRMSKYYKESLISKTQLYQNFDNFLNDSNIKKNILRNKKSLYTHLIQFLLIKQNYNLKVLLWKLHFFASTSECVQYINLNLIKVNNKSVDFNYFLKKGDIITLDKNLFSLNFKKNLQSFNLSLRFCSFIEVDYYTGTIVITKNFDELNLEDFVIFIPKSFNLTKVWNYIQ